MVHKKAEKKVATAWNLAILTEAIRSIKLSYVKFHKNKHEPSRQSVQNTVNYNIKVKAVSSGTLTTGSRYSYICMWGR